jgi:septal ring factor EnvC (AmiA/AmiB activator)|tara:strand:- start:624 stop:992 length:369 start_codon:yes stop_codon:yes gene_type:complete
MGISNFVNVNNIGITSVRSRKQGELADLIVEQIRIQSDISKLAKIQKELTNLYRSVRVNKTNFDKLTSQQRTKRFNNATKMVDDLKNRRNKVEKTINNFRKKLEKNKNKTKKIRSEIRYYST